MKITGRKYVKKYLDIAFIYLYICPLFLQTIFFSPTLFGRKTQIILKLISNTQTYRALSVIQKGSFGSINFRFLILNFQYYA